MLPALLAAAAAADDCVWLRGARGNLSADDGDDPAHVEPAPGRWRCWRVAPPNASALRLSFFRFESAEGENVLEVSEQPLEVGQPWQSLGRFSGLNAPPTLTSDRGSMLIYFRMGFLASIGFAWTSDNNNTRLPFCADGCNNATDVHNGHCDSACFNAQCGWDGGDCYVKSHCDVADMSCRCQKLDKRAGYETDGTSPGSDYPNDLKKCWLLRPKDGNRTATKISLWFERIDIEEYWDVLTVYDGARIGAPRLMRTGRDSGLNELVSTGGEMLITFTSDDSFTESGFTFGWTAEFEGDVEPASGWCSHFCLLTKIGDGECNEECMNTDCEWDGGDCISSCVGRDDHVCYLSNINDGSCDPECVTERCNYDGRDCECELVLGERAGYRSNGGPSADYENDQHLCWLIRPKFDGSASGHMNISLSFRRFDTELVYDYVGVYHGRNREFSPQIGEYDGLNPDMPRRLISDSGEMLITFDSDISVTESGFLFGWTTTLVGELIPADHCAWNCSNEMRGNGVCDEHCMNDECGWDGAEGSGESDCDESRECAPGCPVSALNNGKCEEACSVSSCNWDFRDCECDVVIDSCYGSLTDGSIAAASYEDNVRKCWLIRPKPYASQIMLYFNRFDVETSYDHVDVYDGDSEWDPQLSPPGGFTGKREDWSKIGVSRTVVSTGGQMLIHFRSDSSDSTDSGFDFTWTCEGEVPRIHDNLLVNPSMIKVPNRPLKGWELQTRAHSYDSVEQMPLPGCCWHNASAAGGRLILTRREWFIREQVVDLYALGLPMSVIDAAPPIIVSEKFAQPPGGQSEYFLYVELQTADGQLISSKWMQPLAEAMDSQSFSCHACWTFTESEDASCSSQCILSRRDGSPFWREHRHVFTGYNEEHKGRLRYVKWRDGGRAAGPKGQHYGVVMMEPSLTINLSGFALNLSDVAAQRVMANRSIHETKPPPMNPNRSIHETKPPPMTPHIPVRSPASLSSPPPGAAPPLVGSEHSDEGGGGWWIWFLLAGLSLCCLLLCCGGAWSFDRDRMPVVGQMGTGRMRPMDELEAKRPLTCNDIQYAAFGFYSHLRQMREDAMAGRLRLSDVPIRLRHAASRPIHEDMEDTQEML